MCGGRSQFNLPPDDVGAFVSKLYSLLVEACSSAGETEKAIVACQGWSEEFPEQLGIHERLSQLYQSTGEILKAHEQLKKEVDLNPKRSEDSLVSRAIAFGSCFREMETKLSELQRRAPPQDFESVRALERSEWPTVEKLTRESIDSWVWGCYLCKSAIRTTQPYPPFVSGGLSKGSCAEKYFDRFAKAWARLSDKSWEMTKAPYPDS